jgi:two-component system sensor histidine kinase PilS (NtrC family)
MEGWRSLRLLAMYRWVVAIFLAATYFSGRADDIYGADLQAGVFLSASLAYLVFCAPSSLLALLRRPGIALQLYGNAVVDVSALSLLMYAAGGVSTGLGMLLIVFIAGTSIQLPRRQGLLVGALATLALLGEEVLHLLKFDTTLSGFVQAGMLGMLYLFTAWVANLLSARASAGEALAARRKLDLDNLAQINERIIAHMQVGVLVVDTDARIRLLNQAACALLGIRPGASGKLLAAELPALAASLEQWRHRRQDAAEPLSLETRDSVLLAHFSAFCWRISAG